MTNRPLLEAVGVRKSYSARGMSRRGERVHAVDGIDLAVAPGEAFGLLGGSGAGKSTLVRLLLALERPDEGVVRFDGHEISALSESIVRPLRRRFQPVFQDPLASLDPRMSLSEAVEEPLAAMRVGDRETRRQRVREVMDQVGLSAAVSSRLPAAVSGGERQRAAIARALALEPELLILDEPLSSLDAPVAVQVLELLVDLRRRLGLTVVLVSHDVGVVRVACDRVAVMHAGTIVEIGRTERIFDAPAHPYTRQLLQAAPRFDLEFSDLSS